jgi:excisionase family DNA binding protein
VCYNDGGCEVKMYQDYDLLTIDEACKYLSVKRITLDRWRKAGKINVIVLPFGSLRIEFSEIKRVAKRSPSHTTML